MPIFPAKSVFLYGSDKELKCAHVRAIRPSLFGTFFATSLRLLRAFLLHMKNVLERSKSLPCLQGESCIYFILLIFWHYFVF